jgi:ferredoxin-type protein NapG
MTVRVKRRSRRQFLLQTSQLACGTIFGSVLLAGYASNAAANKNAQVLRPPGALAEKAFLAACSRCGLCVRACPWGTLSLATWLDVAANGTPYFDARKVPCEMCEDIPCIPACPTGALAHSLTNIDDARMGLAVLIDRETCLNLLGLRCDVCYRVCPAIDKAITLEKRQNPRLDYHAILEPVVHAEHCTGCGKCEHACVLDEAAIKVLPQTLAKGKLGDHFRNPWQSQQSAEITNPNLPTLKLARPEGGK